jgi:hypothetical protein
MQSVLKKVEQMQKMIRRMLAFMLIIPCLSVCSFAEVVSEKVSEAAVVVAHGFGGRGGKHKRFVKAIAQAFGVYSDDSRHAPSFPDAGGYYSKTVLYTRPAVLVLVQQLRDVIQSGKDAIHLVAHSCGGGTVITMLAHLIHYEENKDYFKNTDISLENAKAILAALKKGSINITAPLLSAERSKSIIRLGGVLSAGTCMATCAGFYYAAADKVKQFVAPYVGSYVGDKFKEFISPAVVTNVGFVGAGLGAYYAFGKKLKNMYIKKGIRYIMPLVSRYNFDPLHPTPLELLDALEDGLITRLHICEQDEIVDISPEDIEKLRLKAVKVQIVGDTNHTTITNSLHDEISRDYCTTQ